LKKTDMLDDQKSKLTPELNRKLWTLFGLLFEEFLENRPGKRLKNILRMNEGIDMDEGRDWNKNPYRGPQKLKEGSPDDSKVFNGVPIVFENKKIGFLCLKFDSLLHMAKKHSLLSLLMTGSNFLLFFKKIIETELDNVTIFENEITQATLFKNMFPFHHLLKYMIPDKSRSFLIPGPQTSLGNYIYINGQAIFNLLEKKGPIILCHPDIQEKISSWLSDKKNASQKMTRLKNALLKFSCDQKLSERRFKEGKPAIDMLNGSNKPIIKAIHGEFVVMLRGLKKAKKVDLEQLRRVITAEMRTHLRTRAKISGREEIGRFWRYQNLLLESSALIDVIKNCKELESEYLDFRWQPNIFARKIMAKSLGVSEDTIYKTIYLRHSKNKVPQIN
jgi:hypothetical protein